MGGGGGIIWGVTYRGYHVGVERGYNIGARI